MDKKVVTLARGDGIGPEIVDAVVKILSAARTPIEFEEIDVGLKLYDQGFKAGINNSAWESIRKTKVLLKGPITTPQGSGMQSLNVTIRNSLGLFANVRPCRSYAPAIPSKHEQMDLVIIRENEEDLYTGIEYQQTRQVFECLKLLSIPGTERIVRYAFEYARSNGRKKVSCFIKDNIMKLTDGMFHRVFDEVGKEYPEIEKNHYIIDIGTARLADTPEIFDVIVTPNLYGDIISDVAAQISGSVGIAGSANIGEECAMFEAIHGAAPDIAGRGIANPSGLLRGAVLMLVHLGLGEYATLIQNAWLRTIEEGLHTADIFKLNTSTKKLNTNEFADAVISNLGSDPRELNTSYYPAKNDTPTFKSTLTDLSAEKKLFGVDVFFDWSEGSPEDLAAILQNLENDKVKLEFITNRGVKVWPNGFSESFCTDHWRSRFTSKDESGLEHKEIVDVLQNLIELNLDFIKTENLYTFNGKKGFSMIQGQ